MNKEISALHAWLQHYLPLITMFSRVLSALALLACVFLTLSLIVKTPLQITMGNRRVEGLLKVAVIACILCWMVASLLVLLTLPLLMVAKIWLIELLVVSTIACWVGILSSGFLHRQLTDIQAECELATTMTFLQADRLRTQLDALNERIRKSLEPEELEVRETILKSVAPIVMLFLRRETSVVKWGMAALNIGKAAAQFLKSKSAT